MRRLSLAVILLACGLGWFFSGPMVPDCHFRATLDVRYDCQLSFSQSVRVGLFEWITGRPYLMWDKGGVLRAAWDRWSAPRPDRNRYRSQSL